MIVVKKGPCVVSMNNVVNVSGGSLVVTVVADKEPSEAHGATSGQKRVTYSSPTGVTTTTTYPHREGSSRIRMSCRSTPPSLPSSRDSSVGSKRTC